MSNKPRRTYSLRNNSINPEIIYRTKQNLDDEIQNDYYDYEAYKQKKFYLYDDSPITKEKVVYVENTPSPKLPIVTQIPKQVLIQPQPMPQQIVYSPQVAVTKRVPILPYNTTMPAIAPVQPLKVFNVPFQVPLQHNLAHTFRRHSYTYK